MLAVSVDILDDPPASGRRLPHGAFEGMWDGTVDLNWAKQHHSLK